VAISGLRVMEPFRFRMSNETVPIARDNGLDGTEFRRYVAMLYWPVGFERVANIIVRWTRLWRSFGFCAVRRAVRSNYKKKYVYTREGPPSRRRWCLKRAFFYRQKIVFETRYISSGTTFIINGPSTATRI